MVACDDPPEENEPRRSQRSNDYYGKPPTHTRFSKGQSGNPKGPKRKARTPQQSALWALSQKVRVTDGGTTQQMTLQRAILLQYARDPRKTDFLLELAYRDQNLWTASPELQRLAEIKRASEKSFARPMTLLEQRDAADAYRKMLRETNPDWRDEDEEGE